tara:strand:+ start:317 stop:751 length:435 start_codon:yes stop_codon:yes gene_type:complete
MLDFVENFDIPLALIEANYREPEPGMKLTQAMLQDIRLALYSSEYVYLIDAEENPGVAKVGISRKPEKRLLSLQTGSPYLLNIRYTYGPFIKSSARELEDRIHKMLRNSRMSGEWFSISASEIDTVITSEIQKSNDLWAGAHHA